MKKQLDEDLDTMRDEYVIDYSKAETGKYYRRMIAAGHRPVMLDPDIARVFENADAVNDALRSLIEISKRAGASNGQRKPRAKGGTKQVVKA